MSEKPTPENTPIPIRRHGDPVLSQTIVQDALASLRATEVYVGILIDRIELACASDLIVLEGVPAESLIQLTASSQALQGRANRALGQMDRGLARAAYIVADLARQAVRPSDRA